MFANDIPSSSEFAIRWCQVLGFAIPFYDGGSHGNKFFFSGKYSGFFGKARKKRVFSALQMLIFLAGGFANPPGLTMWSKHAYGLTEPYSPLMISYINININMMEMVIPYKLALKVGLYSTNTNNPSKPTPKESQGCEALAFLMLL